MANSMLSSRSKKVLQSRIIDLLSKRPATTDEVVDYLSPYVPPEFAHRAYTHAVAFNYRERESVAEQIEVGARRRIVIELCRLNEIGDIYRVSCYKRVSTWAVSRSKQNAED